MELSASVSRKHLEKAARMKAIVCGGRNVGRTDPNALHLHASDEIKKAGAARTFVLKTMDELHSDKSFSAITCGNEGGAERLGITWATSRRIPVNVFERKGRGETTIDRNLRMLRASKPDLIIAFGGGESTQALLNEARRIGVPVLEVALPDFE
jgi:hypothetical protein